MPRMLQCHFFLVLLHFWFWSCTESRNTKVHEREDNGWGLEGSSGCFQELVKICRANYPVKTGQLQKEFNPTYSWWLINTFLHAFPPSDRMPIHQIGQNFLGVPCSKHCPALVPLASTWTPLASEHQYTGVLHLPSIFRAYLKQAQVPH